MPRIDLSEFQALIEEGLPLVETFRIRTEALGKGTCRMRMVYSPELVRPGGTIAGPALMALADACMYGVVLSQIGKVALAVTTNFNINFLRKPANTDVIAEGRTIKLGKRLAVSEVSLISDEDGELVAHATGTYSIPPNI
ncbi:MAG: PaaI family thioesterase [Alphaproteobacteria bacterium]|nr:PaaI family thioesterase [Alphaproteobacteria bacterium]